MAPPPRADTTETRSALLGALTQPEEDSFTLPKGPDTEADSLRVLSADGSERSG